MNASEQVVEALEQWFEAAMHLSVRHLMLYAKENNLSMSHLGTLLHLQRKGMMGVTEIGEQMGITSAASSQLVEKLVQQKLIERTEDPNDRRVRQLRLTQEGKATLHVAVHGPQSWQEQVAGSLSPAEQELVIRALSLLVEKARTIPTSQDCEISA